MPLIMYPFTGMTGKVAGTLAIPTVMPRLERMGHSGSTFSMLVLAVWPPTTKPVMPLSSGGTLVAKVVKTFGQLGSELVLSLPKVPLSRTFFRFGICPRLTQGCMMSHSAPFTAKTMTFGCDGLASVADLASSAKASGKATKSVTRATLRRFSIRPLLHELKSGCLENYNSCERRYRAIAVVRGKEKRPPEGGLPLNERRFLLDRDDGRIYLRRRTRRQGGELDLAALGPSSGALRLR